MSNLESLFYFAEGKIKFRLEKVEDIKRSSGVNTQRFMEKLERMERFPEYALDREKTVQMLNSIKETEVVSDEVVLMGLNI